MKLYLRPKGLNLLDEEIERLVISLKGTDPTSDDYVKISDNLKVLCAAREMKNDRSISTEMIVGVAANLVGLLIVLNFERTGVITSKAFSMLWRQK